MKRYKAKIFSMLMSICIATTFVGYNFTIANASVLPGIYYDGILNTKINLALGEIQGKNVEQGTQASDELNLIKGEEYILSISATPSGGEVINISNPGIYFNDNYKDTISGLYNNAFKHTVAEGSFKFVAGEEGGSLGDGGIIQDTIALRGDTDILESRVNLSAILQYNINYEVKFETETETKLETKIVRHKGVVEQPIIPEKEGYEIEWQLDGQKYDFNTPVTDNITLKAVYKEKKAVEPQVKQPVTYFVCIKKDDITPHDPKNFRKLDFADPSVDITLEDLYRDIEGKVIDGRRLYELKYNGLSKAELEKEATNKFLAMFDTFTGEEKQKFKDCELKVYRLVNENDGLHVDMKIVDKEGNDVVTPPDVEPSNPPETTPGQPSTPNPTPEQPSTPNPTPEQPSTPDPTPEQPSTPNPTPEQPSTPDPTPEQPSTPDPTPEQPSTPNPTPEQPSTPNPTPEQPSTPDPTPGQPSTPNPTPGGDTNPTSGTASGRTSRTSSTDDRPITVIQSSPTVTIDEEKVPLSVPEVVEEAREGVPLLAPEITEIEEEVPLSAPEVAEISEEEVPLSVPEVVEEDKVPLSLPATGNTNHLYALGGALMTIIGIKKLRNKK